MIGCHKRHRRHAVKVWFLLRAGSGLELGSLDLDAYHALAEELAVSEEEFMVVASRIGAACQALKAVQIELSLKGRQFGLTKVSVVVLRGSLVSEHEFRIEATQKHAADLLWHNVIDKLLGLVNQKAPSMRLPRNDMRESIVLHLLENLMQALRERNGNSTPTAVMLIRKLRDGARVVLIDISGMIMVVVLDKVTIIELGCLACFNDRLGGAWNGDILRQRKVAHQALREHRRSACCGCGDMLHGKGHCLQTAGSGIGNAHGESEDCFL
jgi:hypothetical protein